MRSRNHRNGESGDSGVVLGHEEVFGEHDDVGLNLLRHALGPRRRQAQPHRRRAERKQDEEMHGAHQQRRGGSQDHRTAPHRRCSLSIFFSRVSHRISSNSIAERNASTAPGRAVGLSAFGHSGVGRRLYRGAREMDAGFGACGLEEFKRVL